MNKNTLQNFEECPPKPEAMINSMRAFGYDLSMAIADLIDNSIFAKATSIYIDYSWNNGDPWIRIFDNGVGMSEPRLKESMRLGSQSPLDNRDVEDLGRFGLGLKTASFSQCKLLTVYTKSETSKEALRCWDLDHVKKVKKWELGKKAPSQASSLIKILDEVDQGTVVLWQKLDRIIREGADNNEDIESIFLERFGHVVQYLEVVFHRFLSGRDKIKINVGRHECKAWDPFLLSNQYTQKLTDLPEKLDSGKVNVQAYILPHVSKRTIQETEEGAGLYGWNAHQGFYVYRNKRMIIAGGYLDFNFTPEEHFKLCRIQVDLPNNLDHEWAIDVRKAAASPPGHIRNDLERIVKAARKEAVKIYRARTGARAVRSRGSQDTVWLKKKRGEKIIYQINKNNEVIKRILNEIKPSSSWIRKLFHVIENSVPHRLIIMDNAEHEDCHVDIPENVSPPPRDLLELCEIMFKEQLTKGMNPQDAINFACSYFDDHVGYRIYLEHLVEEQ